MHWFVCLAERSMHSESEIQPCRRSAYISSKDPFSHAWMRFAFREFSFAHISKIVFISFYCSFFHIPSDQSCFASAQTPRAWTLTISGCSSPCCFNLHDLLLCAIMLLFCYFVLIWHVVLKHGLMQYAWLLFDILKPGDSFYPKWLKSERVSDH